MSLLTNSKIMKTLFHIIIPSALILISGCSKDGPIEETSSIYLKQYSIEESYYLDTTLVYNFNGDQWDDFTLDITWKFDTIGNDYIFDLDETMYFNYYNEIKCGISEFNESEERAWQVGDTVFNYDSLSCWQANWGGGIYMLTSNADTFQTFISELKNKDVYWAYYLESEGKIHYGWIRLNCHLFAEVAYNLKPEEAILIGQRE